VGGIVAVLIGRTTWHSILISARRSVILGPECCCADCQQHYPHSSPSKDVCDRVHAKQVGQIWLRQHQSEVSVKISFAAASNEFIGVLKHHDFKAQKQKVAFSDTSAPSCVHRGIPIHRKNEMPASPPHFRSLCHQHTLQMPAA
jgi:hypothetical protein